MITLRQNQPLLCLLVEPINLQKCAELPPSREVSAWACTCSTHGSLALTQQLTCLPVPREGLPSILGASRTEARFSSEAKNSLTLQSKHGEMGGHAPEHPLCQQQGWAALGEGGGVLSGIPQLLPLLQMLNHPNIAASEQ